jgi:hypothetical protein
MDGAYLRAKRGSGGPLSDGVYLLRVTLGHTLRVEVGLDFSPLACRCSPRSTVRSKNLERLLSPEPAQTADSA